MKNAKILMVLVAMTLAIVSCKENPKSKVNKDNVAKAEERNKSFAGAPEIKFDKVTFDFGTVNEGDVIENSFEITNVGKSDLIIMNAKASCGCTIPTWPKDPIAPGETGKLDFKFNTSGKTNKQSKTITLTTNTVKGKETIKISGMVTPKNKK